MVLLPGLLLGSGCATHPPVVGEAAPAAVWRAHRAQVAALGAWRIRGRVAIRQGDDGWNAGFDWQQRQGSYHIRLRGPFGQGVVELKGDSQGAWLHRHGKAPVHARSVEDLMQQQFGWQLPVQGLIDWLRGLPVASQPASFEWDRQGRLSVLQQAGWHIDYSRYRDVSGWQLPDKLQLVHNRLRVKLVIDEWQLP